MSPPDLTNKLGYAIRENVAELNTCSAAYAILTVHVNAVFCM